MSSDAPMPSEPQPVPAAPVPSQPVAYAAPGWESDSYAGTPDWSRSKRPGILQTIGVMSIVVASISLLGSLMLVTFTVAIMNMTRQMSTMATSRAASIAANMPTPAPTTAAAVTLVGARGLDETDRQVIVTALSKLEYLTPLHKRQLATALAIAGQDIFPSDEPTRTETGVVASVRDHGELPTNDAAAAPLYFTSSAGQLQVYVDRAVFRPSTPGAAVVRSSAPEAPTVEDAPATESPLAAGPPLTVSPSKPPPLDANGKIDPFASDGDAMPVVPKTTQPAQIALAPGDLTAAQAAAVAQKAQAATGNLLTPVQVTALTAELQTPGQTLVTQGTLWAPISLAQMQPDGSAIIKFSGGYVVIDPQGQVSDSGSFSPNFSIHPLSIALVIGEAILSIALAIFLGSIGIMMLRGSDWAGRLHVVYALVKIPVAAAGLIGVFWLINSLATATSAGPTSPADGFKSAATVAAILAIVYPIALLIALNTPTVRAYYQEKGAQN